MKHVIPFQIVLGWIHELELQQQILYISSFFLACFAIRPSMEDYICRNTISSDQHLINKTESRSCWTLSLAKMPQLHYHCSIKSGQNINVIAVDRVLSKTERQQVLGISFIRTIRVPDNEESSQLPPDLGSFQLYKVQDYADRLPTSMVIKGGAFFPMHQREAMWINFEAEAPFMIKIYCGGVNVVSGEHMDEDIETKQRRSKLHGQGKPIQDYIVVPEQKWLDGVAVKPSVVRQFVA